MGPSSLKHNGIYKMQKHEIILVCAMKTNTDVLADKEKRKNSAKLKLPYVSLMARGRRRRHRGRARDAKINVSHKEGHVTWGGRDTKSTILRIIKLQTCAMTHKIPNITCLATETNSAS